MNATTELRTKLPPALPAPGSPSPGRPLYILPPKVAGLVAGLLFKLEPRTTKVAGLYFTRGPKYGVVASRPTAEQAPTPPRTWAGQGPHHHGKTTLQLHIVMQQTYLYLTRY